MVTLFFAAAPLGETAQLIAKEKHGGRAALLYDFLCTAPFTTLDLSNGLPPSMPNRVPVTAHGRLGSDIMKLDWENFQIPTKSYVYPHEWLLFKRTGKVPVVRSFLPSGGHTIIAEKQMPEVLHEVVKGFNPNTNYACVVSWTHSIKEHCPAFTETLLRALQAWPELDKVRAVFWLL